MYIKLQIVFYYFLPEVRPNYKSKGLDLEDRRTILYNSFLCIANISWLKIQIIFLRFLLGSRCCHGIAMEVTLDLVLLHHLVLSLNSFAGVFIFWWLMLHRSLVVYPISSYFLLFYDFLRHLGYFSTF